MGFTRLSRQTYPHGESIVTRVNFESKKRVLIYVFDWLSNHEFYILLMIMTPETARSFTSEGAKLHKLINMSLSTFGNLIKRSSISFVVLTPSERPHPMHPNSAEILLKLISILRPQSFLAIGSTLAIVLLWLRLSDDAELDFSPLYLILCYK